MFQPRAVISDFLALPLTERAFDPLHKDASINRFYLCLLKSRRNTVTAIYSFNPMIRTYTLDTVMMFMTLCVDTADAYKGQSDWIFKHSGTFLL